MYVVATAGHVDHGKSTLVRALTGQEPDRLEEERRRGLTIELGYAWTTLPGVGEVAFVDVPGHQRFVTTALAGVGPVPVALVVVAADDPWMPQAAEHLAALDALGVDRGVLAVTRSDLADPAPALARARAEVDRTRLAGIPGVVVSGRSGAGLDQLRRVLADVLMQVPAPDPAADVRLWVDRRFHVRGSGTVVTGTLPVGTITVGDRLALVGERGEQVVRVRGLQSLGTNRPSVVGVARVAVDLGGHAPPELGRGDALVAPGAYDACAMADVVVTGSAPLPQRPLLHVGSAAVEVHARPLADGLARIRLAAPLPLRVGDQALLRDPGARAVWGVRVVDPRPPELRRRGAAAARARDLAAHDGTIAAELRLRGLARRDELRRAGWDLDALSPTTVATREWLLDAERAEVLRAELADLLRSAGPGGLAPAAAAQRLDLPDPALVTAIAGGPLRAHREPSPALARALAALRAELDDATFAAPTADRLAELGLGVPDLAALDRAGHVLHLGHGIVLARGADDAAVARLAGLPSPFTVSAARRALDTSRRVALPLLAHLDRTARTVRLADDTRRLRGS